ncbi:MAG: hypothetical protein AB1638_05160 [Nitrospirota bacterium]
MLWFLIGVVVGILGTIVISTLSIGAKADENMESMLKKIKQLKEDKNKVQY